METTVKYMEHVNVDCPSTHPFITVVTESLMFRLRKQIHIDAWFMHGIVIKGWFLSFHICPNVLVLQEAVETNLAEIY